MAVNRSWCLVRLNLIFILLSGFVNIIPIPASAADAIHIDHNKANPGETVSFTVSVDNAPNAVNSFFMDVSYDFSVLSYRGYSQGDLTKAGYPLFDVNNRAPGIVRIGGIDPEGQGISKGGSGGLVTLTFTVVGSGNSDLTVTELMDDMNGWPSASGHFTTSGDEAEVEETVENPEEGAGTPPITDEEGGGSQAESGGPAAPGGKETVYWGGAPAVTGPDYAQPGGSGSQAHSAVSPKEDSDGGYRVVFGGGYEDPFGDGQKEPLPSNNQGTSPYRSETANNRSLADNLSRDSAAHQSQSEYFGRQAPPALAAVSNWRNNQNTSPTTATADHHSISSGSNSKTTNAFAGQSQAAKGRNSAPGFPTPESRKDFSSFQQARGREAGSILGMLSLFVQTAILVMLILIYRRLGANEKRMLKLSLPVTAEGHKAVDEAKNPPAGKVVRFIK